MDWTNAAHRWRMFERRKLVTKRDAAPLPDERPSPHVPTLIPTPQWTSSHEPVPEPQPWDGRSPQYVTPSMLMNNSPHHAQESHTPAYLPEQILSGAHLTDPSASLPIPHQYQYVPASFNTFSHPGSIAHSPNPNGYYNPPMHVPAPASGSSQPPVTNTPTCIFNSGQYQSLPSTSDLCAAANPTHNDDSHDYPEIHLPPGLQTAISTSAAQFPEEPRPMLWAYTPASPSSPSSTSSFGSFPSSPASVRSDLPDEDAPTDSAEAGAYHPSEVEETQQPPVPPPLLPPPPRKQRIPERPVRLSSHLPATAE